MDITSQISFDGVLSQVPPEHQGWVKELISRLEMHRKDMVGQFRKQGETFTFVAEDTAGNPLTIESTGGLVSQGD